MGRATMRMNMDLPRGDVAVTGPRVAPFDVPNHAVQFYESETFLAERVAAFLMEGLDAGQPLLVIATEPHRDAFVARLASARPELDALRAEGRVIFLDARETLSTFMIGAMPDPELFRGTIRRLIEQSRRGLDGVTLRAYGEMVDVLWRDANPDAAIRLEELWNEIVSDGTIALLCAYAMGGFRTDAHGSRFRDVCSTHAHVIPTERYTQLEEHARLREISVLQQRARALESELEYREELEGALRQALADRERAEAERERVLAMERAARAAAEAASRLKDEFLAVLSHELRTPLNAILGWSHIANGVPEDAATVKHALTVIRRNTAVQLRVIEDLLDVSRIVTGKLRVSVSIVDLGEILSSALDTVRPAADAKRIELTLRIDDSARRTTGDPARLQQVAWNLLSNAVKFTPECGRVEVWLERAGGQRRIVVRDTGQGIAREFLPHVFERFRQEDTGTTRKHGGLGLGLSLVRYLVEAHGGTVAADSDGEGRGATFTVTLPFRQPAADSVRQPAPRTKVTLRDVRVLIVDDDADTRELFAYMLTGTEATVACAASVEEALAQLSSRAFDVMISDIGMPGRDGYVLIDTVRRHVDPKVRSIHAIAVTSYAGEHYRRRAIEGGYDEYIAKPLEPGRFVATVAQLVGRPSRSASSGATAGTNDEDVC
ncbi:ATP-binding protein [Sorangium sp. So ce296]|uniref:hybrid sensor histidine kinase/response regulator n=1 Tax=Sorangium sp. So ce296 TaxID=3133296 RepID=UPI003F6104A5